jgi:hypothetical protein
MQTHSPNTLEGPVTWERSWWPRPGEAAPADPPPAPPRDPDIIRTELVERARRDIAAGTYDTPEKWELALRRLLEETDRLYDER